MISIMIFVLGLVMAIIPKQCTKKELRDDPNAVKKIRRSGFILIGCAVVLELVFFMTR